MFDRMMAMSSFGEWLDRSVTRSVMKGFHQIDAMALLVIACADWIALSGKQAAAAL